ncbi:MAG: hypothetical protein ACRESE_03770 [Gammaproteobacteria bacterium]
MKAKQLKMREGRSIQALILILGCLMAALWVNPARAAGKDTYPTMAPIGQYRMASEADEIALARSAAPASISDHAEVLVLGERGYDIAVKGTNGFVCLVVRAWDNNFTNSQFWNPKMRAPFCDNAAAARSVLPRYLTRTEWVLAGVPKTEMQNRERAELAAGKLKAPEPGAMCYMMSKGGYLNDAAAGPWHPHVMLYVPRTEASLWGANLPGSPVLMGNADEDTSVFYVIVPHWSDGTLGPAYK